MTKELFSEQKLKAQGKVWSDVGIFVHPTAEVSQMAKIGKGSKIWNNVQIRDGAIVGPDCVISKDCYICADVIMGARIRLQNGISVYLGVLLHDDVFVGPHAVFTNDLYPRAFSGNNWEVQTTNVYQGASIGANSTTICGNNLGRYSMIGAGAVVTSSIGDYELWKGVPARSYGFVCKCGFPVDSCGIETCSNCDNQKG